MSRVWFITGASSGFGRAVAEAAVAAGDVVVGAARRTGALDGFVAAHPKQVQALRLDVTDLAEVETAVEDVLAWHGRIDVLVNNAGRTHVGAVEETTDAELRDLFGVGGHEAVQRARTPCCTDDDVTRGDRRLGDGPPETTARTSDEPDPAHEVSPPVDHCLFTAPPRVEARAAA